MSQWKAGDVVELKSGGRQMTITEIKPDGMVLCEWVDENNPQNRAYPAEALMSPRPPGPSSYGAGYVPEGF